MTAGKAIFAYFIFGCTFQAFTLAACPMELLSGDGLPGLYGHVRAMTIWDPDGDGPGAPVLVIGGQSLSVAGDAMVSNLAYWDGSKWYPLDQEGFNCPAQVIGLAVFNGDLVVAGDFAGVGGIAVQNIALWDGSTWHTLGNGLGGRSNAWVGPMAIYRGELIAGGYFASSGDTSLKNVARWNGSEWLPLGDGFDSAVQVLRTDGDHLIAGGNFKMSGGVGLGHIASWDGSGWAGIGSGFDNVVYDVLVTRTGLVATGGFNSAGGKAVRRIARWRGHTWHAMGDGFSSTGYALAEYGGDLYAAGQIYSPGNLVVRWTGRNWGPVGGGLSGDFVSALIPFNGELVAGGRFETAHEHPAKNIAHWNNHEWKSLGKGIDAEIYTMTIYKGSLVAAGNFTTIGGIPANQIAQWDGTSWHPMGSGVDGVVWVLGVYKGALLVGGALEFTKGENSIENGLGIWNGDAWVPFAPGVNGVTALVAWGDELVVTGDFDTAGTVPANRIAAWNGVEWRALGPGLGGWAWKLAVYDGSLIAGGSFCTSYPSSCVLQWDEVDWQSVGKGIPDDVYALGVFDGELIAGGDFTGVGDGADYIAAWNGNEWHRLGGGLGNPGLNYGDVRALTVYNGELIAAGAFTGADGLPANHLARWDGTEWHSLGAEPDSWWFTDLEVYGRELFVAGGFLTMNDSVSAYWAHWAPTADFGDVNGDGVVKFDEAVTALGCLGDPMSADAHTIATEECLCAFNSDGDADVDLVDFAAIQNTLAP